MPVPLSTRAAIITTLRDNEGRPIELRGWFVENIIKPLDGFKTWPRGPRLCEPHRALVGTMRPKRSLCKAAPHDGCDGLKGEKIIFVVVDVTRQEGKTTSGAAYELTDLLEGRNCHCLFLAASESQSDRVFDQKFLALLDSRPDLKAKLESGMDSIRNPARNNTFLYVPTSAKSIAAGTYRLLFVDEVRDVDPEVIVKLMMSMASVTGVECPSGHMTAARPRCPKCNEEMDGFECEQHGEVTPPRCPVCSEELEEFFGRALLMSSAGEESALFTNLVERLVEAPHPNWHLFSSSARLNKAKSRATVNAFVDVLGEIESIGSMVKREAFNIPGSAGDQFLTAKAVNAVVREDLYNLDASVLRAVGFLDCSRTNEITSLVIAGDPESEMGPGPSPFERLRVLRIDVWDPKATGGRVDYADIKKLLADVVGGGRFPGLLTLAIDTRLLHDAQELFDWTQRQPWGSRVASFKADQEDNSLMWGHLSTRVLAGKIEIPRHKRLIDELRSARVAINRNNVAVVVDSAKGNRRGGRLHRDVSMSLAGCCYLAARYMARAADRNSDAAVRMSTDPKMRAKFRPITGSMKDVKW